ncbi:MAG: hypothetical protein IT410_04275 [Candidatus Doudnabacteria bacterium]|nr:hypothetical protein [Candidatus Doudnabacteria bacterium]
MFDPKQISNKSIAYFAIIAILIGLGIAYFVSQPNGNNGSVEVRTIKTGQEVEKIQPDRNTPSKPAEEVTSDDEFCIQVITPARNPQTGDTEDFPSPCDVPEGWELIRK